MTNTVTQLHPAARTAAESVIAVMNEVLAVGKDGKNQEQGFNFRGIDAVMNAVGPAFRKHGVFVVPTILSNVSEFVATKNGGTATSTRLNVEFAIYGQTGSPIVGSVFAEAMDHSDKSGAKAMSVALRTFLLQVLCLPTQEPDPDSYTYEVVEQGAPSASELKSKIAAFYPGKPKGEITSALTAATGKSNGWTVAELAGFLETLEAAK